MNTVTLAQDDWITVVTALKVVAELIADDVDTIAPSVLKQMAVERIQQFNEVEHKLVQALKENV